MAPDRPIYMDHHATTPVDPRVVERMLPYFTERFGNAGSRAHRLGWEAEEAVEAARRETAALVGAASPHEIVFTSGATESINLALKGALMARAGERRHLVTTAAEHPAVLDTAAFLAESGLDVTVVPVAPDGRVDPEAVRAALRPDTALVSVIHGNHEVGSLNPVAELGAACRAAGAWFHVDAAQTAGWLPLDVDALQADLLSLSAHKIYGPKGVGALYVRRRAPRVRLVPLLHGGGHERGRRAGTLAVPLIVGMGEAARLAREGLDEVAPRVGRLRDRLEDRIRSGLEGVHVNGARDARLPNNLHLSFDGLDAERLVVALREVALSSGAACASATPGPSHVLQAMGIPEARARASLRLGLGRGTTGAEVDRVAELLLEAVPRLRARRPT